MYYFALLQTPQRELSPAQGQAEMQAYGDFHARETTNQCLEFENRLQSSLTDLRLIRGVTSQKFAPQRELIDESGNDVVIHAPSQKVHRLRRM